jgi:RHS repeat-associated protein
VARAKFNAAYNYYKHGPLARTVLGQQQTQGVDYSYTLQGWLKGTNVGNGYSAVVMDSSGSYCAPGSALTNEVVDSRVSSGGPTVYQATQSITFEAGFQTYVGDTLDAIVNSSLTVCTLPGSGGGTVDTASASGVTEAYPIALDAYSFSLHYYPQDYKPIGQTTPVVDVLQALGGSAAPLYNGNIAAMAVVIDPLVDTALVYSYHYDQLNRLAQMDAYKGLNYVNHTFTPVHLQDYQERPTYDPNGNITTYVRHGYGSNIPMDSLTYNYYGGYNRLQRINDGAGGSYTTDLKDQGTGNNYTYDSIGNLKKDVTNGVSNIDWTVYGKIADLTNGSGTITYTYDAAGNRISKLASGTTSIYVRDAQGNILSIYTWPGSGGATQKEVDLYGSSRLGSVGALTVAPTTVTIGSGYGPALLSTFTRGEKSYELSNHLGNVLTTITDKKIAVPSTTNSSLIDHFTADIATAQDYYPFGMLMPGRTFTASTATNYRYGFNGKENDNEVKGVGDQIDYGMRVYDPRAGRFLSIDALTIKYPSLTSYQFASNSPIQGSDLDGRELDFSKGKIERQPTTDFGNTTLNYILNSRAIGANIGISAYNQGVDAAEDLTNLAFSSKGRRQVVLKYGTAAWNFIEFNEGLKSGQISFADLWKTSKLFLADPKNVEQLGGSILFGLVLDKGLNVVSNFTLPGVIKVDLMGGEMSALGKGWINYDKRAIEGIKGNVRDFPSYFKENSVSIINVDNPQASFLTEITGSLKKGGIITVRGQKSNPFFNKIWNGSAAGLENYEVVSKSEGLSTKGYSRTDGSPLRGSENSMQEIVLRKKNQ